MHAKARRLKQLPLARPFFIQAAGRCDNALTLARVDASLLSARPVPFVAIFGYESLTIFGFGSLTSSGKLFQPRRKNLCHFWLGNRNHVLRSRRHFWLGNRNHFLRSLRHFWLRILNHFWAIFRHFWLGNRNHFWRSLRLFRPGKF